MKQDRQKADIAIILGAAASDSEVSPVFRERINHGIWLYENGYVKKLLLTGGTASGNNHSDAHMAMQYALSQDIPEKDILLEEESTITMENLDNAKVIMEEEGYSSAIIVSDPLHMKRSMYLAQQGEKNLLFSSWPTPTTMYKSLKTQLPFLLRETFLYIGQMVYDLFF
ncbi:MAG: YdcF family protein [Lachnospiraceae bacterium]|nr:YdcF family protein [Lachnospiraceae bacterium]